MDAISWAAFALIAAAALVLVRYIYQRREPPGRGRTVLTALRWGALTLLILLLFDPELPVVGHAAGGERTQVVIDGSLSMRAPIAESGSGTRWDEARAEARRLAGSGDVLVFGEVPRRMSTDELEERAPEAPTSRLYPALRAASESGARRVVVITDGGVEDAAEVSRMLPRLGLDVEFRMVGGEAAPGNWALAEVRHADWVEEGADFEIEVGVVGTGEAGEPLRVRLFEGDRALAEAAIESPGEGRVATARLSLVPEAPEGGGLVRYDVVLEADDAIADDNRRTVYLHVGERPGGVVIVSFRPDWEPRFLQPVLEQALGLPVRGYLHVASDRFVRLGAGVGAGQAVDASAVRSAVEDAELLVLHGLGDDSPGWAREAASTASRVLVFPAEDAGALDLPVRLGAPAPGEWYATAAQSSPVAPLLATIESTVLPPLTGLRPVVSAGRGWSALEASPMRRAGGGSPVVVADEEGGRRWAVATANGFWRWAFRGGESRQAYRRLWAAVGGWLIEDEPTLAGDAVRPEGRVLERGRAPRWVAPGLAPDSMAIQVVAEDGTLVADTVVDHIQGESATIDALPPGHYRYTVTAYAGETVAGRGEGVLSVEAYSAEYARAGVTLSGFSGRREAGSALPMPGRPLHTTPWPYLLLVGLVSAEWVLRRRWGLR